jgi:hypothetical protein
VAAVALQLVRCELITLIYVLDDELVGGRECAEVYVADGGAEGWDREGKETPGNPVTIQHPSDAPRRQPLLERQIRTCQGESDHSDGLSSFIAPFARDENTRAVGEVASPVLANSKDNGAKERTSPSMMVRKDEWTRRRDAAWGRENEGT